MRSVSQVTDPLLLGINYIILINSRLLIKKNKQRSYLMDQYYSLKPLIKTLEEIFLYLFLMFSKKILMEGSIIANINQWKC